jgi:ADP-dependent NAD(P)H-hydrate dehydratase / NAD(P)H-hydrate epimerase
MKILSAQQIKEADRKTIQLEPITAIDLMERAATKFTEAFCNDYQSTSWTKHIFCGNGNNGGDGLAVARMLHQQGHPVIVYLLPGNATTERSINLNRIQKSGSIPIFELKDSQSFPALSETDVIIDAILGNGLTRPIEGLHLALIRHLNACPCIKISIDIPSGLFPDQHSSATAFEADRVYSFQCPKLAFLLPENSKCVKRFRIIDIKLHQPSIDTCETSFYFLEKKDIQNLFRPRDKFTHKGSFGHALLIAGSFGKIGAAVLSAKAALRSGLGLLTVLVPSKGYDILQTAIPEAMCTCGQDPFVWVDSPDLKPFSAIGIGPGIGTDERSANALKCLLKELKQPLVLDADALNILAAHTNLWSLVPKDSIITPHPGEFKRLAGAWKNDFERLEIQRALAREKQVIIVLKGAHTSIAYPDGRVFFNSTGNSGMATAGSGDVLTGILTALLAQGYPPTEAALVGVYLHGLAGNQCLDTQTKESMIASDIIGQLGKAFKLIRS